MTHERFAELMQIGARITGPLLGLGFRANFQIP